MTAVFGEKLDIYFARQQVDERLAEAKADAAARRGGAHGADRDRPRRDLHVGRFTTQPSGRKPATATASRDCRADGSYITPEGQRLRTELERAAYLRTVQDWIIRPQLKSVPGVAGVDAIGGYVKQYQVQPDPSKLIGLGLSFSDVVEALEKNNASLGAGYLERNGEGYVVRVAGRIETHGGYRQRRRRDPRRRAGAPAGSWPKSGSGASCAAAARARTGRRSSSARR